VVECTGHHDKSAEEFSLDRVKELLRDAPLTSAQGLCVSVLHAVGEFSAGCPPHDDQTALALSADSLIRPGQLPGGPARPRKQGQAPDFVAKE
jgi:hypothetical protein